MALINVSVDINDDAIVAKLDRLSKDEKVLLEIHNLLAKMCDPYVPYLHNPLSTTIDVTPNSVRYTVPYARYQYYGIGFKHTLDIHPQATALWDKVMLSEHGEEFRAQVEQLLRRRIRELYG